MNVTPWMARLLGYEDVAQIERWQPSFGALWAHQTPFLVLAGLVAAFGLAFGFYRWFQPAARGSRWGLILLRGSVLAALLLVLADPIIELTLVRFPQPVLWVVVDGSESLSLADELPGAERERLEQAVDWGAYRAGQRTASASGTSRSSDPKSPGVGTTDASGTTVTQETTPGASAEPVSRIDLVRAFLERRQRAWLTELATKYRVETFALSTATGVEPLGAESAERIAEAMRTFVPRGPVTAIGDGLEELSRRQAEANLAGIVVLSDFDQNAGTAPVPAAKRLGVPLFTIGLGPETAVDLAVDLLAPPTMKKGEQSTIVATVRQRELDSSTVTVRLWAEAISSSGVTSESPSSNRALIGERSLTLALPATTVDFSYTPGQTGRYQFSVEVDPVPGETVTQNNRVTRDVRIIDDFLRLLYVEYEPTWEWRFVKEVFHRDKLVGMRGFRTFLRSADPVVRETNELFLSSLTLPRSEFFEADVVFLGDLPASALSARFCEMTREFVDQFGGGLVVLSGPRFGPGQLAQTALAEMLPVAVDPDGRVRDDKEFRLQLTPLAGQFDFMRIGSNTSQPLEGWDNLGKLPWYQPVLRADPRATVLAQHPTDLCRDGKTKQPLIAVRPYGRGEVVYLGFNELWRLRRIYGEEYYRQFWGQLIYRLGLSHALGDQKRFVVRTDRQQYRSGEQAVVTVEAFDRDFRPLGEEAVPDRRLRGSVQLPEGAADGEREIPLVLTALRPGVFETRLPVELEGEHRIRVTDPITQSTSDVSLMVTDVSVERRNPIRNVALQQALAMETGGRSYDLTTAAQFLTDFDPPRRKETTLEVIPLSNTWLTFFVIFGLMVLEWGGRKWGNLT